MIVRAQNLVLPGATDVNAPMFGIDSIVTDGLITVTATANYPKSNLANPATFLKWQNSAATATNMTLAVTTGYINYVGVAAHNLGTIGAAITIQGDSGDGYVDLTTVVTPPNDQPLIFLFTRHQYVGIRLVLGAGSAAHEMAVLYVGDKLLSQRNIYVGHNPITLNPRLNVVNGRSENGQFLGRIIVGERRETSVELSELSPMWVRGNLMPFLTAAKARPFFFAWRPANYSTEVGFCWLTSDPVVTNSRANGMMSTTLNMAGIA